MILNRNIKFTYAGCSPNWDHPVDKRRFLRYCNIAGIPVVRADIKNPSNIVVITQLADLTSYRRLDKSKCKIIFDANDGYLIDKKKDFYDLGRGAFKYLYNTHKFLELSYKSTYLKMCERADAVICSHPLQFEVIKKINRNVHLITDYAPQIKLDKKTNFAVTDKINILWEGLGSTRYMPFTEIERIFGDMPNKENFHFHFFTDLEFGRISNGLFRTTVMNECRKKAPNIFKQTYFYQWNEAMFSSIATNCDFAIIPIAADNAPAFYKPENKLILMWHMAIPTIVSFTPSYSAIMEKAVTNLACVSDKDWRLKVELLISDQELRKNVAEDGFRIANNFYDETILTRKWDAVLASVI